MNKEEIKKEIENLENRKAMLEDEILNIEESIMSLEDELDDMEGINDKTKKRK